MKRETFEKKMMMARQPRVINPSIETTSKKNFMGEIINPTKEDIAKYNKKYTTIKLPKKQSVYQKFAMSKPVGKVLDSKVGKAGVKVGDNIIKGVKAPGKFINKQWKKNQEFKNKNSTQEKFNKNSK